MRIPAVYPAAAQPDRAPRLSVLLPALQAQRLTGGPNTALNLAGRLIGEGIRVRFVSAVEPADADLGPIRTQIAALAGIPADAPGLELNDATAGLHVEPDEVLMATWWPTAHLAKAALPLTRATEFVYLVQDYEPGFYPWSTNYALAAATYGFPHRAIFNEALLQAWFDQRHPEGRGPSIAFEPAVDGSRFHAPGPGERGTPHELLFYARPHAERNAFELGLRALRLAAAAGAFTPGRWTAVSVGAPLPELPIGPGLTMTNAPWLGLDDWAARLRRSAVLVSLMISPHTSYPPLEMAACGGLVVTNTFETKTAEVLAGISPAILAVAPEPEALALALARAARVVETDPGALAVARDQGPGGGVTGLPASWAEAFRDVVPWLARAVRELSGRD